MRGAWGAAVLLAALAGCGHAGDEQVTITLARDDRVADFVGDMARALGQPIFLDPGCRGLRDAVGASFRHDVSRSKLLDTVRAILAFYEVQLMPVGGDFLVAVDPPSSGIVKPRPELVSWEQLAQHAHRPDAHLVTFVPVWQLERMYVPPEAVFTATGARAHDPAALICVFGSAPTVVARARAIRESDG